MWELCIVVDGKEHKALMSEPYTSEEEVNERCKTLRKVENMHVGLENGDFIVVNKECCNFHFIIKKVK